jgi:alpha-ketoglutarate-dependent taurine dioxygenase
MFLRSRTADIPPMDKHARLIMQLNRLGYAICNEQFNFVEIAEATANANVRRVESDALEPRSHNFDNRGAWSNIYGAGKFPMHTDFAYEAVPPRFIVLRCVKLNNSNRSTRVFDTKMLPTHLTRQIAKIPWMIRHKERRGVIRMIDKGTKKGFEIWRYDPVCMSTYFSKHRRVIERLEEIFANKAACIQWQVDWSVIIDNWRCLHGRGLNTTSDTREEVRVLERYSIYI